MSHDPADIPLRVGIDLLFLRPGVVGGTETYARGLLSALAMLNGGEEYLVFVNQESATWSLPDSPTIRRIVCRVRGRQRWARYAYMQLLLPRLLRSEGVDVLHSLGYVTVLRSPCPRIVTIPDVNYEAFGTEMTVVRRAVLRGMIPRGARAAQRVVTISEFSKSEIVRHMHVPPERITVTYLAVADPPRSDVPGTAALRKRGIQPPYIVLFSGADRPNKNLARALEAFAAARRDDGILQKMVLVGHRPTDRLNRDAVDRAILRGDVISTGYVPDLELDAILSQADFLLFPSLYEGFGLPVLEAMSAGIPVACSRVGPLPEVGGSAAWYFDPHSVADIAGAISRLARDRTLRHRLSQAGRENLRRFSWAKTAEQTRMLYRTVGAQ